jgi:hypothetical protein
VKRCVSGKREAREQADLLRLGSASKGGGARAEACEAVWAGRARISQRIAETASPENLVCRHDRLRDAPWPKAAMAESAELASPLYTGCTEDREMRSGLALPARPPPRQRPLGRPPARARFPAAPMPPWSKRHSASATAGERRGRSDAPRWL